LSLAKTLGWRPLRLDAALAGMALAVLLAGWAQAWALAPQPRAWAQIASVGVLVLVLSRTAVSVRRAAVLGLLFGVSWLAGTFWWLFISMYRYGNLPAVLAGAAVLALAAVLSLYLAAAAAAWVRWRSGRPLPDAFFWAALWLLAELARAQWFTGFPWGASGYAQVDSPLAALAPWLGVYGMGAVAAMAAALLALWLAPWLVATRPVGARLLASGLAVALLAGYSLLPAGTGGDFTRPSGRLSVTLIQGNVPQDAKFDAEQLPGDLIWHAQVLMRARTDLVITPETAVPLLPDQLPLRYWSWLTGHFSQSATSALIGAPLGDFDSGYTNSVQGLQRGGEAYRYDKYHLVPFGEFIPFGFRWFVDLMAMPLGDFSRGQLAAAPFVVKGERVAPNICYEDLFGEELAAGFKRAEAAPTILANLSNIGWFGDTVAVDQHLQISRLRALELQRPMLRATNTGATVIIDHHGRVTHRLAPYTKGVLEGEVQGRVGITPFAWWASRWSLWPLWLIGGLAALLLPRVRRRQDSGAS